MKLGILYLQLVIDFFFVEEFCLHLLYFIEIALDERDVLLGVEIFHFKLDRGMDGSKLLYERNQDVPFALKLIILYFQLIFPLLFVLQVEEQLLIFFLHQAHLQRHFL